MQSVRIKKNHKIQYELEFKKKNIVYFKAISPSVASAAAR